MIKGLRETLAEAGKIKIGGLGEERPLRGGGTWRLPESHDYFTITKLERDDGNLIVDQGVMRALAAAGYASEDGRIRRLPIILHSDDIEEVFPTALVRYSGKQLACRGDGEVATQWEIVDGARTGRSKEVQCPCSALEPNERGERRCKYSGILHCSLALPGYGLIGSVYKWRTTSQISCGRIRKHLKEILRAVGALRGVPHLTLVVQSIEVKPKGQRAKVVPVCHIDLCEQVAVAQRAAIEAARIRNELAGGLPAELSPAVLELELPGDEDAIEAEYVAQEFHPETGEVPDDALTDEQKERLRAISSTPMVEPSPPPSPPQSEPKKRVRRVRCKSCERLFFPAKLENGVCADCRAPAAIEEGAAPAPPSRPSRPSKPMEDPRQAVRDAMREAINRNVSSEQCVATLGAVAPNVLKDNATVTAADAQKACDALRQL